MKLIAFEVLGKAIQKTRDWFNAPKLWKRLLKTAILLLVLGEGLTINMQLNYQLTSEDIEKLRPTIEGIMHALTVPENIILLIATAFLFQAAIVLIQSILSFIYLASLKEKKTLLREYLRRYRGKGFSLWKLQFPVELAKTLSTLALMAAFMIILFKIILGLGGVPQESFIEVINTILPDNVEEILLMLLENPTQLFMAFLTAFTLFLVFSVIGLVVYTVTIPLMYLRDVNVLEALKETNQIVYGNKLQVMAYLLATIILDVVLMIPAAIIGMIFAIPALVLSLVFLVVLTSIMEGMLTALLVLVPIAFMAVTVLSYAATVVYTPLAAFKRIYHLSFVEEIHPGIKTDLEKIKARI
ncbi:MAG: hypothetical protein U9M95_06535 [Candidatus Altiarchaeota archaeon]|nr:hypothetical protein [Candidatus Altiarchaeota archaeon]